MRQYGLTASDLRHDLGNYPPEVYCKAYGLLMLRIALDIAIEKLKDEKEFDDFLDWAEELLSCTEEGEDLIGSYIENSEKADAGAKITEEDSRESPFKITDILVLNFEIRQIAESIMENLRAYDGTLGNEGRNGESRLNSAAVEIRTIGSECCSFLVDAEVSALPRVDVLGKTFRKSVTKLNESL